jgi:proteasome accessory factor C
MSEGRLGRRLQRILLLLPYAIKHPGVGVDELSTKFGVKRAELLDDLKLVFLCGLPGYGPGDLIDVSFDDDRVFVRMADYFKAPFRLTPAEALALYAGGQALAALPEMSEADALVRALDKLKGALGLSDEEGPGLEVLMEGGAGSHLRALNDALETSKRLRIEYLSASSGELNLRDVDPWGLVAALGRWYLIGLDHLSSEERTFRVDRIKSAEVLETDADVPDDFDPDRYRGVFSGNSGEPTISFEISPEISRWFQDYYPVFSATEQPDGWTRVELVASGAHWAASLLIRLGAGVRNVEPPEMLDEARALAESIAASYR